MAARLSSPIEALTDDRPPDKDGVVEVVDHVDVAIVGSGYGASVAAVCLAGRGRDVVVLERGREYAPGDFPVGLGEVPGHVRFHRADGDEPIGYPDALFDIRIGKTIDVLVGSGLGGTSLINANVAVQPEDDDFRDPAWPHEIRSNPGTVHEGFRQARKLLRVHTSALAKTDKFEALKTLAGALGATCEPAPVTVNFVEPARNGGNGSQPACTRCGNCVTGCNVGAKNTLAMTALPEAKARGARLYTGAVVLSLEWHEGTAYPWIIRFRRTASEKTPLQDEVYRLAARDVILAAGTLGSTEILLRSREIHGLQFSSLLGTRFSGNGDAIAFGFAGDRRVHAIGEPAQHGDHEVGPTISGIARTVVKDGRRKPHKLTIEDASVPTSIRRLFAELMATGAFLHRLDRASLPAWYQQRKNVDPIAVPDDAIEHSLILLTMGDDGAGGTLKLREPDGKSLDDAHLIVDWPSVGRNPALRAADRLLRKHDRTPGFNGGQYVPNPFWRALPERASSVMSGPAPAGRAVTVHPLGGCGMGDDIRTGVVNHLGQVFRPDPEGDGTEVYDGLHVLDGSIIPKALGLNPLLTIAALSWRAADALRTARGWARWQQTLLPVRQPIVAPRAAEPDKVGVTWREQLVGSVKSLPAWLAAIDPKTRRWLGDKGLIVTIELRVADLESWLANATETPLRGTAELHANPLPADVTKRMHRIHTPAEELGPDTLVVRGHSELLLFKRDDVGVVRRCWRTALALWTYYWRRQPFRGKDHAQKALPSPTGNAPSQIGLLEKAWKFCRLGWEHARYRRLQYRLDFGQGDTAFRLDGEKVLAWRVGAPRLWDALLNLPFTLSRVSRPGARASGNLEVDMTYFTTTGTPQVSTSPHLPATVVGLSRFGMLFARALLQTHLWEFGAPNYPVQRIPRPAGPLVLEVGKKKPLRPERIPLWVPLREGGHAIRLQLTRYRQDAAGAQPVLLIHGLAQGSLIYTTDTLDTNMTAAMWQAGYDVWLLDYRLSNMLPDRVPQGGWYMDEIARYDIPAAVRHVYTASGNQRVRIFAHCVGATSVAMAILKDWLRDPATGERCVECIAFNAIHPWTMPSAVNEFRARFGSFFRNVMGQDLLDPVPAVHPTAAHVLLDRLAFSVARYDEEGGDHRRSRKTEHAATVCDRMTFLYGRMWRHMNLDPRTHAQFPMLMGPGSGDVYRQLYYFALNERLTDHEGANTYLTEDHLRKNWKDIPTFFFHGEESMVFNPESAERSAIRLDAILNQNSQVRPTPVRLLRVPAFGHMDVVFGKDAHTKVYPILQKFFANPADKGPLGDPIDRSHDLNPHSGFRLTAGPVLRGAWLDDDKKLRFRLWAETNDEVTSLVDGVQLVAHDVVERSQWTLEGCEPRYRMVDARLDGRSAAFSLAVKVTGAGKTVAITAAPTPERTYDFSYDTLPWLSRLRRHDGRQPCRDMRFLVASCRYPGTPFESEASDAIFAGMAPHIEGRAKRWPGVHMLFLVGDQIYADATANIIDSWAWRERYAQKYRVAFTSKHAQRVLARVPTHFAIDDHEIADNWSGEKTESKEFAQAMCSARSFQSSERGGKHPIDAPHKRPSTALWYSLSEQREHCCPTFVMDTRSERKLRLAKDGPNAQFISPAQLGALTNWLASVNEGPWANMPKFIFCGVGIAPISREFAACGKTWRSEDWWPGYPRALSDVLGMIHRRQIQHVVFVSGDLHLSSVSRLTVGDRASGVTVWQIVSSGLYAPMPFANAQPDSYDWNRPVRLPRDAHYTIDVVAESGLLCTGRSHFLRVDAECKGPEWTLSVGVVGADGAFVDPARRPPRGFDVVDHRWVARLGAQINHHHPQLVGARS